MFRGAQYLAAGKTGTAQVFSLQGGNYKGHLLAEHLRDHALFIAYAPVDHPQIALALIVENGGWGAQAAGPIARRVLDFYLVERQNPQNEAAAVAAAASATEPVSAPVIGDANRPVTVAAGFNALPQPVVPSAASAADAASASAASAPDASAAAGASAARPTDAEAAPPRAASLPPIRRPHRPRRPAGDDPRKSTPDGQPLAAGPRDDDHRATAAANAADAGAAH